MFSANEMHRVSSERERLSVLPTDVVGAIELSAHSGKYSCDVTRSISKNTSFIDTDQLETLKNLGFNVTLKMTSKHDTNAGESVDAVVYNISW